MEVIRLLPGDDRCWPLMPEFFKRCQKFVEKYLPDTNPHSVTEDIKQRWIKEPFLTFFCLAFDDGNIPFGHVVAWMAPHPHGRPYVFIYQAYCDKYSRLGKVADDGLTKMAEWVKQLNTAIKDDQKIQKVEFCTWRDVDAWVKYFKKLQYNAVESRHIIRFDLKLV